MPKCVPALVICVLATSLAGCAALRQNMRGQELSYRGAWHCEAGSCKAGDMVKSTSGTREGTVNINTVKLAPKAGMAFTAAAPFDTLTATARDCKGESVEISSANIIAPGDHGIRDQDARESWVVWVDPSELSGLERGKGACAVWKVEATATWSDGASYSLTAGVDIKG
ncbi:hypothetical protein ENSA5_60950 [Enhygromyxa salina]|uniref:Lipoprotein n=1 Tax=Enhygromyxa salina TaxID=215803 RepID=A0A2S9XDB3_9BACT|nr:hypothetical protein [Enhygromyxa salina]PRP90845.1 hypothetical protein ENSA5_60950 [Enhygromyxa salina]